MKRPESKHCKAGQHSDQMLCACGLAWDVNDPDPPQCRGTAAAARGLAEMRAILRSAEKRT